MNKKAKTKAQKADEDANLDEALDESFPASDPPSMTQPRTGADVTQRKPKRPPKGEAIHRRQGGSRALGRRNRFVTTVNHPRLVKTRVFQQTVRTRQAPLRTRQSSRCGLAGAGANPNICGAAFAYARLEGSHTSQADYGSPGRMKPKQMIPHLIGFFIPSYLILSADFELKRPPTG